MPHSSREIFVKTALLVIDVQESFRHRPYWEDAGVADFIARTQSMIDRCRDERIPVVQIFHVEQGDASHPFALASGHVRTLRELSIRPDAVFHKNVHSAMFGKDESGRTLDAWLRDNGIERVLVTGIRTEQCCETTTRHASDLGFDVRYVMDATLTFPMRAASGREYSAADIRERTELVLADRFATIVNASNAL
jgi:nicotinamidase-related amidase